VYGLKIKEVIVRDIDTDAEVKAGISPVDDLKVAKLYKVCVLGISNWKKEQT
jgi:hypothetical protein